jgi:uncharacterized membrane protein
VVEHANSRLGGVEEVVFRHHRRIGIFEVADTKNLATQRDVLGDSELDTSTESVDHLAVVVAEDRTNTTGSVDENLIGHDGADTAEGEDETSVFIIATEDVVTLDFDADEDRVHRDEVGTNHAADDTAEGLYNDAIARLHVRVTMPALFLVWVLGMGVTGMSDKAFRVADPWISASILIWAVLMGASWFLIRPAISDTGPRARSMLATGTGITHLLLVVALYLMVFKPGA